MPADDPAREFLLTATLLRSCSPFHTPSPANAFGRHMGQVDRDDIVRVLRLKRSLARIVKHVIRRGDQPGNLKISRFA